MIYFFISYFLSFSLSLSAPLSIFFRFLSPFFFFYPLSLRFLPQSTITLIKQYFLPLNSTFSTFLSLCSHSFSLYFSLFYLILSPFLSFSILFSLFLSFSLFFSPFLSFSLFLSPSLYINIYFLSLFSSFFLSPLSIYISFFLSPLSIYISFFLSLSFSLLLSLSISNTRLQKQ